jgi:hypothetical protein
VRYSLSILAQQPKHDESGLDSMLGLGRDRRICRVLFFCATLVASWCANAGCAALGSVWSPDWRIAGHRGQCAGLLCSGLDCLSQNTHALTAGAAAADTPPALLAYLRSRFRRHKSSECRGCRSIGFAIRGSLLSFAASGSWMSSAKGLRDTGGIVEAVLLLTNSMISII